MHILNLLKYFPPYPGGIENIACDLVEELAGRGVLETVLSHGKKKYQGSSNLKQILSTSYGEMLYAPMAPSFPFKLNRELRSGKYDLLHVHVPNVSAFWPLFLKVDIPIVVHWHADVIFPKSKKLCCSAYRGYSIFERALLSKAAAIVPTSETYLQHSAPLSDFRDKCTVIPLGLNFSRMTPVSEDLKCEARKYWMKGDTSFLVASAGRFAHYKGFVHLIRAAAELDDVTLVIAGDGEERAELLGLVKSLGLQDRVILPGKISDARLHGLMAGCDAFCLPSVERTEAFGVVLLEAMFYARPLITSEIVGSATSWVNIKGETGLTVPVEDESALSKAFLELKDNPEMGIKMGRAARKRLEDNFSITKTADSFYKLYSRLL